jgi:hypothetical protein
MGTATWIVLIGSNDIPDGCLDFGCDFKKWNRIVKQSMPEYAINEIEAALSGGPPTARRNEFISAS